MFLVIFCGHTEASKKKEKKKEQNFNWGFIYSKYVEYCFKLQNPINTTLQLMLVLPVCIPESISETDGRHMRAPREGHSDVLYWLRQGSRQKGFSCISHSLATVVSRGSAQSTAHPNQPRTTTFGLLIKVTPWPRCPRPFFMKGHNGCNSSTFASVLHHYQGPAFNLNSSPSGWN